MLGVDLVGDVGRSLREGFFMFWETLWPLILGFTLSGAVQAFVPRERIERAMGDHRPKSVARASGWGMVSSSCSYAATAMAKSLFQKGADFTTAMIFMFASTNLVLELGIVLFVLLGWQFAAAEFIGGPIMIAFLALTGSYVLGRAVATRARAHLTQAQSEDHEHGGALEAQPWSHKLRSRAAWSDAASYTVSDLTMLRRELVIGYVVAGFLAVLVPVRAWNDVFLHGHGVVTTIENVVVGPFIAIIAFVCSIGNVPLAAALWHGGISFGGVIAFVFADLITLPLLLIYRKYYGTGVALRLLLWFWAVMTVAGFIVEELFSALGAVPHDRSQTMVDSHFAWNYTTFLNIAFLALAAYLYWLYRNRARFGGGEGYAIDPVCGMQVQTANAPASRVHEGSRHYFCSDHCADRFDRDAVPSSTSAAKGHGST
ncbi:MAG TPA: permease [Acidimicrobiia bacterium]|jgi:hypothetical protein|nr:permease [Acidimicrobiia bacterium]